MSRITLGLFGAARAGHVANGRKPTATGDLVDPYRAERLAGLTPIERAMADAKAPEGALVG